MPESTPPARIVLTTVANAEEAAELGRTLVEEQLAPAATLIPSVQSIYRWKGEIDPQPKPWLLLQNRPRSTGRPWKPGSMNYTVTRPPEVPGPAGGIPQQTPISMVAGKSYACPDLRKMPRTMPV